VGLTEKERQKVYRRSGGRCECTAEFCDRHPPGERCPHPLASGFWDVTHRHGGGHDKLGGYTAMCAACLEETAFMLIRDDDERRRGEGPRSGAV
jgi:hypothetical protein